MTPASRATTNENAAELEQHAEVRDALEQAGAGAEVVEQVHVEAKHKVWLGGYAALIVLFAASYFAVRFDIVRVSEEHAPFVRRITLGAMAIVATLVVDRCIDAFVLCRLRQEVARYNLRRLIHLVTGIAIFFIVLSILSATWYTAVVSLGLISLVLGFALQTPITSFIGWIYILVRSPYRVGDRVRIGEATGDVIDVSYLDTTLWEFGGEYLSTDHPSGRIIKFPNSTVLQNSVYNYSWPLFPYIWNEIRFQVAYDSDLEWVAHTMQEVAREVIGREMRERVRVYRRLLAKTPVNAFDVREEPAVFFRTDQNTWLDATVRYLVEPRTAGRVKSKLTLELLKRLNGAPDRVRFPHGAAR
jgi:small-conductance mechanosensitive channel